MLTRTWARNYTLICLVLHEKHTKNKCSEATEPNEVSIVVQPIEATKPNEIPIVVHAVLSGYITTLKNKQKLNVSNEGPSFN